MFTPILQPLKRLRTILRTPPRASMGRLSRSVPFDIILRKYLTIMLSISQLLLYFAADATDERD